MGICCFIGHRKIKKSIETEHIYKEVKNLIDKKDVDTFLFGSRSEFNDLCYRIVTNLKEKYQQIKRIYVRGEFQYISDDYKNTFFTNGFEDSFLPECCRVGSRASYIERNKYMIDKSDYCVFYYDKSYSSVGNSNKSGTKIAFDYAVKQNKFIINMCK